MRKYNVYIDGIKAGFNPNQQRNPDGTWGGGDNVEGYLENKYKNLTIDIYQDDKRNVLTLSRIIVPKEMRGEGIGTNFMNDLTDMADKMKYKIILTPASDYGGDIKRLREFYKRFGFIFNKGGDRDFSHREDMYRLPK